MADSTKVTRFRPWLMRRLVYAAGRSTSRYLVVGRRMNPQTAHPSDWGSETIPLKRLAICLLVMLINATPVALNAETAKGELRVLFIGNSLTFANDLPAIVAAMAQAGAEAGRQKQLIYRTIALPDFGLKEHWQRGEAQQAIARGNYDFVVLQQGPSSLPESREILLEYVRMFDREIRRSGARLALYMVWPSQARIGDFDRVVESYQLAAKEVHAMLLPVGQAWREVWKRDANIALYSEDGFHPSLAGSYLAGLVIYARLFGSSPVGLPARLNLQTTNIREIELSQVQASLLQLAVAEAIKMF